MDCSPPGSSTHGILQARVLEWLPNPGIEPGSPALQADALPSEPPGKPYLGTKQQQINAIEVQHFFSNRLVPELALSQFVLFR